MQTAPIGEFFLRKVFHFSIGSDVIRKNLRYFPARFSESLVAHPASDDYENEAWGTKGQRRNFGMMMLLGLQTMSSLLLDQPIWAV